MCIRDRSDTKLNTIDDVKQGTALTAEITNERWNIKLGYKLPVIKPETAAERLLDISSKNTFTLYEFFLTDHIGHGRYEGDVSKIITMLDEFLFAVLDKMNRKKLTLIICSDHGNCEDLSVKTHTTNPALTITAGKNAGMLFGSIKNLAQIKDAILQTL